MIFPFYGIRYSAACVGMKICDDSFWISVELTLFLFFVLFLSTLETCLAVPPCDSNPVILMKHCKI